MYKIEILIRKKQNLMRMRLCVPGFCGCEERREHTKASTQSAFAKMEFKNDASAQAISRELSYGSARHHPDRQTARKMLCCE